MLEDVGRSIQTALGSLFTSQPTDAKVDEAIKTVCNALLHANVSPKLAMSLRSSLISQVGKLPKGVSKPKAIQQIVVKELTNLLDPQKEPYKIKKNQINVILFVGLQGCGKTTTICKYAQFYKKSYRTGIVCADTFRAGAFDQIRQNALKIKVPFYGSSDPDPVIVAKAGVDKFKKENFELILVDTSGRNTQEAELFNEMKDIVKVVEPNNVVFVMDAGIGQSAETQALGFAKAVPVGSIVLTKLDGTTKAGGALTSVACAKCPIEFVGLGEGMIDLEPFEARRFVNRMLGLGDVEGLVEKVNSLNIDEKAVFEKIQRGHFTLRDFYDQFQQLMSLGPLKNIMSMLPGNVAPADMPDEDHLRRMVCIFDSLAKNELDSDGSIFENCPSRIYRVARGSGTSPQMVQNLLSQFQQCNSMMKKMAKMPGFGDIVGKDPTKMSLSDKTKMKNQLKGMLPKNMFDQMSQLFN